MGDVEEILVKKSSLRKEDRILIFSALIAVAVIILIYICSAEGMKTSRRRATGSGYHKSLQKGGNSGTACERLEKARDSVSGVLPSAFLSSEAKKELEMIDNRMRIIGCK